MASAEQERYATLLSAGFIVDAGVFDDENDEKRTIASFDRSKSQTDRHFHDILHSIKRIVAVCLAEEHNDDEAMRRMMLRQYAVLLAVYLMYATGHCLHSIVRAWYFFDDDMSSMIDKNDALKYLSRYWRFPDRYIKLYLLVQDFGTSLQIGQFFLSVPVAAIDHVNVQNKPRLFDLDCLALEVKSSGLNLQIEVEVVSSDFQPATYAADGKGLFAATSARIDHRM